MTDQATHHSNWHRPLQITFDAADPHELGGWWADLIGYEIVDPHDTIVELLEQGVVGDADVLTFRDRLHFADAMAVEDPDGVAPRFYFQRVPEAKATKNRMHFDIPVPAEQLDAEVERVTGLGATLVQFASHPGHRWAVMHDPEGNEFCLH